MWTASSTPIPNGALIRIAPGIHHIPENRPPIADYTGTAFLDAVTDTFRRILYVVVLRSFLLSSVQTYDQAYRQTEQYADANLSCTSGGHPVSPPYTGLASLAGMRLRPPEGRHVPLGETKCGKSGPAQIRTEARLAPLVSPAPARFARGDAVTATRRQTRTSG
jgi:hypothetical protein